MDDAFVVGVDLDDVVVDYAAAFRPVVAKELGVDLDSLTAEPNDWDGLDWGVRDTAHYQDLFRIAVSEHRILRDAPPIPGGSEALWTLAREGCLIRIITHRLRTGMHALIAADTVAWLDQHHIPYDDLCFTGRKAEVDAHVYIDDAPHNLEALRAAGKDAVAFTRGHNKGIAGPRVNTWPEFVDYVRVRRAERKAS